MLTPVATAVVVLYPGVTSNATPVACREGPTVQWTGLPGGSPVEETHHLLETPGTATVLALACAGQPHSRQHWTLSRGTVPRLSSLGGWATYAPFWSGGVTAGWLLLGPLRRPGARAQHTDLPYRFPLTTETTTPQISGFTQMPCLQTIMGMSPLRKRKPPRRK